MLKDEIRQSKLFLDLTPVLEPMGLKVLSVSMSRIDSSCKVSLIIKRAEGNESVDDCAKAYGVVYPRLSLDCRDLELEVSTPGIQRVFKDVYEFELFVGRRCHLYDGGRKASFTGIISRCGESSVFLSDYKNEDNGEAGEMLEVSFADVNKAKLDYRWEDVR